MRVTFTRPALSGLVAILDRIRLYDPRAADRTLRRFEATVRRLSAHPESGRRQDVEGVRKAVVLPGGYLVFYRIERDAGRILIIAVVHPRQERPYRDG